MSALPNECLPEATSERMLYRSRVCLTHSANNGQDAKSLGNRQIASVAHLKPATLPDRFLVRLASDFFRVVLFSPQFHGGMQPLRGPRSRLILEHSDIISRPLLWWFAQECRPYFQT